MKDPRHDITEVPFGNLTAREQSMLERAYDNVVERALPIAVALNGHASALCAVLIDRASEAWQARAPGVEWDPEEMAASDLVVLLRSREDAAEWLRGSGKTTALAGLESSAGRVPRENIHVLVCSEGWAVRHGSFPLPLGPEDDDGSVGDVAEPGVSAPGTKGVPS